MILQDVFPDNATGRKILSFVIKCPSDGCSWTGELRDKEVKTQNKNYIRGAVYNIIITKLSRPQSLSATFETE